MRHYPLAAAFERELPDALKPQRDMCDAQRPALSNSPRLALLSIRPMAMNDERLALRTMLVKVGHGLSRRRRARLCVGHGIP
jgi:hypothetical protein